MYPGRSGYTFLGWTYDATHTFTAQWEAITYTVTFDANGGEGAPWSPDPFQVGVTKALSKNAFAKDRRCSLVGAPRKTAVTGLGFTDQQEITFKGWLQQSDSVRVEDQRV